MNHKKSVKEMRQEARREMRREAHKEIERQEKRRGRVKTTRTRMNQRHAALWEKAMEFEY